MGRSGHTEAMRTPGQRAPRALFAGCRAGLRRACSLRWHTGSPRRKTARAQQPADPLAALKAKFARPTFVPNPAGNPPTAAKVALGKRLFEDPELSSTGTIACRSCHDPKLAFTDGESTGKGVTRQAARAPHADAVERRLEPAAVLGRPRREPGGPDPLPRRAPRRDGLLARERRGTPLAPRRATCKPSRRRSRRTRASRQTTSPRRWPPTSARWCRRRPASTSGLPASADALTPSEVNGFVVFTGKGRCINCHTGFAFTDHGFYDIGLPSEDAGRGPIVGLSVADPCLQGADPARARLDRALHARRLARHAGRRGAHLRDGRHRPADTRQGPARYHRPHRPGADRPRRLPREPVERDAAAALDRGLGQCGPAAHGPRCLATRQSSARATSCSRPQHVRLRLGAHAHHPQRRHAHPQRAHLRSALSISIPAPRSRTRR